MTKHRIENAAQLAATLARKLATHHEPHHRNTPEDVSELQRIARAIHKMDERACKEDLGCRKCGGDGYTTDAVSPEVVNHPAVTRAECRACAGSGSTTGKRETRLTDKARAIATAYGMRLYVQGDPRGWPLYLIPDNYPATEDASGYSSRGVAVCPS